MTPPENTVEVSTVQDVLEAARQYVIYGDVFVSFKKKSWRHRCDTCGFFWEVGLTFNQAKAVCCSKPRIVIDDVAFLDGLGWQTLDDILRLVR